MKTNYVDSGKILQLPVAQTTSPKKKTKKHKQQKQKTQKA